MKISPKVREVLKAIAVINPGVILRSDYLFSKFQDNGEGKVKTKGTQDISIQYDIPKGEVELEEHVGIGNITDFLSVVNSYNKDELKIGNKGLTILLSDKRKKGTYVSQTVSILPIKNDAFAELYKSAVPTVSLVLSQAERDMILKDLAVIQQETLSLISKDGGVVLKASNDTTGNECEIQLDSSNVQLANGVFHFPNADILKLLANDDYKISVVEATDEEDDIVIVIIKFEAIQIQGLSYISMYANE